LMEISHRAKDFQPVVDEAVSLFKELLDIPEEHIPEYVDAEIEDYEMPAADQLSAPAKPKMATIYIGKGKKDKISKGDILGFLCKKGGLQSAEIGKIDVNDRYAYAAISRTKLRSVLNNVKGEKIKGVKTIVEEVR
jgi:ATP-dependent RNA helicase DbpA